MNFTSKKKIIITGGTGFIGNYFISNYYNKYNFYCLLNKKKIKKKFFISSLKIDSNQKKIIKFFQKIKPDCVVHLATNYVKYNNFSHINKLIDTNIKFGTLILEAMKVSNCKKIINFGSMFEHNKKIDYYPQNLYAATKQAFQNICYYYHLHYNINCINLKLFDSYGPNDKRDKLINNFLISKKNRKKKGGGGVNKKILIKDGSNKLNLVHVNDICEAINTSIKLISSRERYFRSYSLPARKLIKVSDLIKAVQKFKKINFKFFRGSKAKKFISYNNKYPKLKSWKPKISIQEGLNQCINLN